VIKAAGDQTKEGGNMVLDPICLMEVDEKSARFKTVYNGQTFFFCDKGCKQKFEEEPEKYIDIEEKKEK
jgi:YHS domain-containing protein